MLPSEIQKKQASSWFEHLQSLICKDLEAIEQQGAEPYKEQSPGFFKRQSWDREGGGGGTMAVLQGRVFEKAGVNVSTVFGELSEAFRKEIPGAVEAPSFWASGVSVVIHPRSPYVPIVHMNTRMIVTTQSWFGGGADLTPTFPRPEHTQAFHESYKQVCDTYNPEYYPKYKKWADDYFYIPHRKEQRGVGGIFYDYHNSGDWEQDFAFTQAIGSNFSKIYSQIVQETLALPWTQEDLKALYTKRGRYVEFNLLYDRGTVFGLKTNGHIDAILMSLPPMAGWFVD